MPMLLAVFSDTHGVIAPAAGAVRRSRPDIIIHLGDFSWDAISLKEEFPHIELHSVRGNCDLASRVILSDCFFVGKVKLFIAHGHEFGVKRGLDAIKKAAREAGADIALFGHTHRPLFINDNGLLLLNPGSSGCPPHKTWARLEISDAGEISCSILDL